MGGVAVADESFYLLEIVSQRGRDGLTNAVGLVKVVLLFAVSIPFARTHKNWKLAFAGRDWRLATVAAAVEVAVEDTWVASLAEED